MGGDQLVAALTDEPTDEEKGEDIRTAEKTLYMAMIEEVEPMECARELIERLKGDGKTVVLASSAKDAEVDHYLDLLDARDLANDWTSSGDVERTKPAPPAPGPARASCARRPRSWSHRSPDRVRRAGRGSGRPRRPSPSWPGRRSCRPP